MKTPRNIAGAVAGFAVVASLSVGSAQASPDFDQASGSGKTYLGATFGFVAKANLTGEIEYQSADHSFRAHCHNLTSFDRRVPWDPMDDGAVTKVRVTATCTDQNGKTVYFKAKLADHGEPGTADDERIFWSYEGSYAPQGARPTDFISDFGGSISNGNLQVFYR
jgi:hypothetical protein